jgi:hypothetical protein
MWPELRSRLFFEKSRVLETLRALLLHKTTALTQNPHLTKGEVMKVQAGHVSWFGVAQFALRQFCGSLISLMMLAAATTTAWSAGVSDIVWLESNSTAGNPILAFQNNGTATPSFLGSTPAGGIGVYDGTFALGPFDSDQNLITNADGTLLFAVNSGSNSIAVFNIMSTGLTPVAGSPFPSGGSDPVSLGLYGDVLVVVNKDLDPAQNASVVQPNYTTFRVSRSGALNPVVGSTVSVAYGSSPSQALVSSQGPFVFGADFLGGLLQSFSFDHQGRLRQNLPQALPNSLFTGQTAGHQPLGMRTNPNAPVLYVDIPGLSEVAVYRYFGFGVPSFVTAVSDSGQAPCWATVNHAGTLDIQHFVMDSTTGGAFSSVIDASDQRLYVSGEQSSATATTAANAFHSLEIDANGMVSEPFPPAVLPIGGTVPVRAQGITVAETSSAQTLRFL